MAGVIQVPPCPARGVRAHASITSPNAVSTRISKSAARTRLRSERETLNSSTCSTIRGSGLHQRIGWPAENQGKMPRRYALDEPRDRQVASGREQPVGLGERRGQRRKRRACVEPGNHAAGRSVRERVERARVEIAPPQHEQDEQGERDEELR